MRTNCIFLLIFAFVTTRASEHGSKNEPENPNIEKIEKISKIVQSRNARILTEIRKLQILNLNKNIPTNSSYYISDKDVNSYAQLIAAMNETSLSNKGIKMRYDEMEESKNIPTIFLLKSHLSHPKHADDLEDDGGIRPAFVGYYFGAETHQEESIIDEKVRERRRIEKLYGRYGEHTGGLINWFSYGGVPPPPEDQKFNEQRPRDPYNPVCLSTTKDLIMVFLMAGSAILIYSVMFYSGFIHDKKETEERRKRTNALLSEHSACFCDGRVTHSFKELDLPRLKKRSLTSSCGPQNESLLGVRSSDKSNDFSILSKISNENRNLEGIMRQILYKNN